MNEAEARLSRIAAIIQEASEEKRLCPLSELAGRLNDNSQGFADTKALLAESAPEEIKVMRGKADDYYFMEALMTEAYAIHLFRLAERNLLRLIAETTRDESRIYPRPTLLAGFLQQPFLISQKDLNNAVDKMLGSRDYSDIKLVSASNGDKFLYSEKHLNPNHAQALAEWAAVGEKENP